MKTIMKIFVLAVLGFCLVLTTCKDSNDGLYIYEKDKEEDKTIWDDNFTPGGIITDFENFEGRTLTINPNVKYQEIKGFAAADAWTGAFVGWYWDETVKQKIADYFFSQESDEKGQVKGIGLSMWRVNLGGGSFEQGANSRIAIDVPPVEQKFHWNHTRRSECYLADINDPSKGYNWNKCAGHQYWMREAKKRGLECLVAASFSPVVAWTLTGTANNRTASGGALGLDGNLTSAGYDGFAGYLADVADHFAAQTVTDNWGKSKNLRLEYFSPLNEPQFNWSGTSQEGSGFTNANITRLVKAIDSAIKDPGRTNISPENTKIIIAEASSWIPAYTVSGAGNENANTQNQINAFFNPAASATYIGNLESVAKTFVGHTYWTHENDDLMRQHRTSLKNRAAEFGVDIWNTEWCGLGYGVDYPWGRHHEAPPWYVGLYMAKLIHTDLTVGNLTSWSYWTAMDIEGGLTNHYNLMGIAPGASVYDPNSWEKFGVNKTGSIKTQANLWTLGNYSLFVRPGFKRIDVSSSQFGTDLNNPVGFMVSAYQSPPGYKDAAGNDVDRIVVVYVNWMSSSRTVAVKFNDSRNPTRIRCYLTNDKNTNTNPARDEGKSGMRRMAHENGVYTIPQKSVVTVVYDF